MKKTTKKPKATEKKEAPVLHSWVNFESTPAFGKLESDIAAEEQKYARGARAIVVGDVRQDIGSDVFAIEVNGQVFQTGINDTEYAHVKAVLSRAGLLK